MRGMFSVRSAARALSPQPPSRGASACAPLAPAAAPHTLAPAPSDSHTSPRIACPSTRQRRRSTSPHPNPNPNPNPNPDLFRLGSGPPCPTPTSCSSVAHGRATPPSPLLAMAQFCLVPPHTVSGTGLREAAPEALTEVNCACDRGRNHARSVSRRCPGGGQPHSAATRQGSK
eukprot:scaffold26070_cov55-Phaeocystis_antarctica.AAC.3